MTKQKLLTELRETSLILRPSDVHGIGVFAIRDIPKGTRNIFSKENSDWIKIPIKDINLLPKDTRALVDNYCVYDKDFYYVEKHVFKKMDIVSFLNHSANPNVIPVNNGKFFETTRDIRRGQELFIDYSDVV